MKQEDIKEKMRDRRFFDPPADEAGIRKHRAHLQQIFVHRGETANREREAFFNEAYAEIMLDLFLRWAQTQLEEKELRESLYQNVLALGAVSGKLAEYSQYSRNAPFLMENEDDEDDESDN